MALERYGSFSDASTAGVTIGETIIPAGADGLSFPSISICTESFNTENIEK